ncbi:MAG TPA: A24 family peptidase [Candidatus Nanoarchaeia archaeon]|nr:A24 family peptidase [Candidatus Nanoarchaeia archaeon]
MLFLTIAIITILTLLVASYADIKTREVPDWLSYSLIFSALGIRAIFSVESGWSIFLSGVLGFTVCFVIACLFYYTSQWGGGDAKLLMGMGAMIGLAYPFSADSFNLLFFFLALLFIGAAYGLLWMLMLAVRKRKLFWLDFKRTIKRYDQLQLGLLIFTLFLLVLVLFYHFLWPLLFFPLGVFYLFLFINTVEKTCFLKKVHINDLTEGDWLAEDVNDNSKLILKKKTLEKEDLWKLKESNLKEVLIKEGIPFIPSFLLAYLLLVFGKGAFSFLSGFLFS